MDTNVLNQVTGENFTAVHGDCVEAIKGLPDESVHYSIYSPPFASLFTYSNSERDMGNSRTYEQFWNHYKFLLVEKMRVLKSGRLSSVHCMNLPTSKQNHGVIGLRDFRGDIIRAHCGSEAADIHAAMMLVEHRQRRAIIDGDKERAEKLGMARFEIQRDLINHKPKDGGFIFHSEVVIWKDPVTAMQRTKAIGLLYKQLRKDSCMSRQGVPDYVCTFRKPGINPEPVTKTETSFPVKLWQNYASPVWMDINQSNTLQKESARDHADERHICPLQLEVIDRCLDLWTNPNDVVLSPFMGIGSEGFCALKKGRKFIGMELKDSYFKQAVGNLKNAHSETNLLDFTVKE